MDNKRLIYPKIIKHLTRTEYSIITGPRQAGKTTLLKQVYKHLINNNLKAYYISFENSEILKAVNENPDNIFNFIDRPAKDIDENTNLPRIYLLIDEIQYAANPTNFLKYLYDTYFNNLKLIVTGSSAFYIDQKFNDSLAGRKRIFNLPTLNFSEFLIFKNKAELNTEYDKILNRPDYISIHHSELMQLLNEYMTYGGYPAVVMEPDITEKKELLNELKTSFVKRDIYEAGVEKELVFFQLMRLLSEQTGNLVNRNELGSTLKVDSKTVDNYLFVLQKCFHISLIAPFFSNLRKEITKMPKIYFNDLGMRNVLLNNFEIPDNRSDRGALFENLLFIRLCEIHDADNVKFWHTADGKEVDFIVETTNKKGIAYEAKYSGKLFKPNKYNTFKATYPEYPLVTVDLLGEAEATPYLKLK